MQPPEQSLPIIFVINLARSSDRWGRVNESFHRLGLRVVRVEAVDGKGCSLEQLARDHPNAVDLEHWRRFHHREPRPTEIACYLSHLKAIQAFEASGESFGLIAEDDAEPQDTLPTVISDLICCAEDWDLVKLHARHPGPQVSRRHLSLGYRLTSYVFMHAGASAYLLNSRQLPALQAYLQQASLPYDHRIDRSFEYRLRLRGVDPMPVQLASHTSTIGYNITALSKRGLRKYGDPPYLSRWRVPLHRGWGAIKRVYFNLLVDGGLLAILSSLDEKR